MKRKDAKAALSEYLRDIVQSSVDPILEKKADLITKLSTMLMEKFNSKDEVFKYLDFILNEIDELNKFFSRKRGKSSIPYSSLFNFANKQERLDKFLFEKKMSERRKSKEAEPMAGVDSGESEEEDDLSDIIMEYKDNEYGFVFFKDGESFFFSEGAKAPKILVQLRSGRVVGYKKYINGRRNRSKKFVSMKILYYGVRDTKKKSHYMKEFIRLVSKSLRKKKNER